MKNKLQWIFPIITYALIIPTWIVGVIVIGDLQATDYLFMFVVPALTFLMPLYSWKFKRVFPLYMNIMICVEIILCIYGGFILNMYDYFPPFDLILHGYFGFSCSMVLYYILMQFHCKKINSGIILFLVFLSTMGVGAMWELWEFICDLVTGGDALRIQESINKGLLPVADTMEDLSITIVGFAVFCITFILDKKWIHSLFNDFYPTDEFEKIEK